MGIGRIDELNRQCPVFALLWFEEGTDSAITGWPCYNEAWSDDGKIAVWERTGDDGLGGDVAV